MVGKSKDGTVEVNVDVTERIAPQELQVFDVWQESVGGC